MSKKPIIRRVANRILHLMARFGPGSTSFRPFIHELRGVKIYGKVFIGDDVYLENEYPENIEIHDGAGIALRTTIISHCRGPGKIIIEKNVWIGTCCTVAARNGQVLRIGEGSVLAANSVVTKDVPPGILMGGIPAKPIAKATVPGTLGYSYSDFKKGLRSLK